MGGLDSLSRSHAAYSIKSDSAPATGGGFLPLLGGYARSASGVVINQVTTLQEATAYACIMVRGRDMARCTPSIRKRDEPRSAKPNTTHALAKLFMQPNWIQTQFEFFLQMNVAYLMRQNAYAAILRDGRGNPTNLIPINPDAVFLLEASDGSIFYQANRVGLFQMFALKGLPMAIPAEDMLHLRGLSLNMLLGAPTIDLAQDDLGLALGLSQQASRLMKNGARPGGVLQTPKALSDPVAKRLREQWDQVRSGLDNVGRTVILEEGLEWKAMQLSSVDQQFIEQRKASVEEVARRWGVPLYKLSVAAEFARVDLPQADVSYVNTSILPDLLAWKQKFEKEFDLAREGLIADFDERPLLHPTEAVRVNNQRLKIMSGISTQNECRAENGDPPLEGGNVLLTPVNLAAAGSDATGTAPDGAGRPPAGELPDPGAANGKKAIAPYNVKEQSAFVQQTLAGSAEPSPAPAD